ncbi:pecanex-like protein 3 [Copidosoma floridanum]|uniref:pecanex-like protein 3 n=1 Tax=Copidosoma floridanum TaxID=29053 RepID=UPI000C6FC583|nr:pecanex-like protein 3 [Copidosoma floridanum]
MSSGMGSQTLEILRQGIWASLTGGWFYDPHLDVFSNTFHLYVWLFLLCLPFTIYLYFPPSLYVWLSYCSTIILLFGTIKCINHALHRVYDTSECLEEPNQNISLQKLESEKKRDSRTKRREQPQDNDFLGIELQVLNGKTNTPPVECSSRNSYIEPNAQNADADSITSDYTRDKPNSTIDLKVEIHRKNSSESSEEAAQLNKPIVTRKSRSTSRKFCRHASEDSRTRYSKSNNLGKTGSESQIKQTSSLELEQADEFEYWKYNQSVRRLNSSSIPMEAQLLNDHPQSLEIISSKKDDSDKNKIPSHPQSLEVISKMPHHQLVHPQSLETIRASSKIANPTDDNNLPLHPQSLEMINSKKVLPQNTIKRYQLQLLPYLSCGSEIVHPIAEQSDEQVTAESSGRFNQESYSPLLMRKDDDRYLRYVVDTTVDNDSANSRDALLEEPKPMSKRKLSNTSQSSWDLSDGETPKERRKEKMKQEEPANGGSIVGIDWLFENGEGEPWTNKILWTSQKSDDTDASDSIQTASTDYLQGKEPDSGSSSTTTLSLENEVKRKLLPSQSEVDSKRQQGAIPKQSRARLNAIIASNSSNNHNSSSNNNTSSSSSNNNMSSSTDAGNTDIAAGAIGDDEDNVVSAAAMAAVAATPDAVITRYRQMAKMKQKKMIMARLRRERASMTTSSNPGASTSHSAPIEYDSSNLQVTKHRRMLPATPTNDSLITLALPSPPAPIMPNPSSPLLAALFQTGRQVTATAIGDPMDLRRPPPPPAAEARGSRSKYKRLHRSNGRRRRHPRTNHPSHQDQEFLALTHVLYHITTNTDTTEDPVHYFRDDTGRWVAYTIDENSPTLKLPGAMTAAVPSGPQGLTSAAARSLPPEHNERLLNTLLRQHLNQNLCFDLNYAMSDINDAPSLSNNNYSSPSVNSAGLAVILDSPSMPTIQTFTSPVNNNNHINMNNNNNINNNNNNSIINNNNNNNNHGSSTSAIGNSSVSVNGQTKIQNPLQASSSAASASNQAIVASTSGICTQMYEGPTVPTPQLPYCQFNNFADRHRRLQSLLGNLDSVSMLSNSTPSEPPPPNQYLQMPLITLPAHQENLSWNRFINDFRGFEELSQPKPKSTRHYYKWYIGKLPHIKVRFDRLSLLALLDRNLTLLETMMATLLAAAVAGFGLLILQQGFYKDIFAFLFCFVIAGCQYSLLKSVQPDAASPTHGFNRIIVFSRPIYFILCTSIIMILDVSLQSYSGSDKKIFGMKIFDRNVISQTRNVLLIFLLFFPVVFSLGLFPQINTFLMYLCEHIDIHIFGGNATTSLVSSIYCLFRSVVTALVLSGFVYGALVEANATQHILFSIFLGLLVAVSYHLSRSSSDPSVIWDIVKSNILPQTYSGEKPVQVIENTSQAQQGTARRDPSPKRERITSSGRRSTPKSNTSKAKKKHMKIVVNDTVSDSDLVDLLPQKLRSTVKARLKNDVIACSVVGILSFAIHASTVFTALQPDIYTFLRTFTGILGFLLHYVMPQLRKQLPWLCLARPVLRSYEYAQFEVKEPVRIMWFEKLYVILCFFERNILYPILFLSVITECAGTISKNYGSSMGAIIIATCGLKALRSTYSDPSNRYLVLIFADLLFRNDFHERTESLLIDFVVTAIAFAKIHELYLKIQFIVTYIAPWQITWGSAFHAFAQPFSVPHSAMLFLQAGISAVLSAPLNPLLGSAIFISSYVRPVKFWERDYKTRRVDHSNTRMSLHLERNLGADDNNLNSIFYEQLTHSLQHSLYGDLALGRWGAVEQGDCFLLASDYLNCLVHVVQLGNGLVTFQLRGLEFRGTYCQQREVEAISEGIEDNDNCCCCEMGHSSHVLSVNAAFSQRWLAWEVASSKYVLEGYSISDNSAASMLQVFDFRKVLVTYYVKSIIFYAVKSPKLKQWLENKDIFDALKQTLDKNFVDLDPVFNMNIDEDFDFRASGITRSSFCNVYLDWIQFCASKQDETLEKSRDSCLVSLCLSLSLLGRRVLGAASHNTVSSVEFFLYGLHALFKGDFRITSIRDEWVLHDVALLRSVVAKGVRMALKLHQDHFMSPETYEEALALYNAIDNHDRNIVISHEADPLWRNAILSGAPSLLALRRVMDEGMDEYKVIMLNKRFLSFRVIKMNRECVRGLWAGQQQELVYLRNRNPERGSIQNAKQALRNIINSSCDQPIGYPIYVSPLTTSYAETNEQLCSIVGGPLSLNAIRDNILRVWRRLRKKCGQGCSSGGTGSHDDGGFGNEGVYSMTTYNVHTGYNQSGHNTSGSQSMESGCQIVGLPGRGSLGRGNTSSVAANCRGSLASMGKPTSSTLASLAGLLNSSDLKPETKNETSFSSKLEKEEVLQRVRITDENAVYDSINLNRPIDVYWPDERMRQMGGRSGWLNWSPRNGMEGCVVHRWLPNHRDPNHRSHVDKVVLLVRIDDKYVPIAEQGVRDLGAEV